MGLKVRMIPTLLVKNGSLVKGKSFDSWRCVGSVLPAIKVYTLRLVDEMIVLNVHSNQPDFELIEEISADCFVPLTVGGGVRNIEDIRSLLKAGADKVSINSAAFDDPNLISKGASLFGSQCIVVSIDVKDGVCYKNSGTLSTGYSPLDWALKMEERGAGELLITSIPRDGTMEGYDHALIKEICSAVSIPVIASGGAATPDDFYEAIESGASAVAAASLFHFTELTPLEAKMYLKEKGVAIRQ